MKVWKWIRRILVGIVVCSVLVTLGGGMYMLYCLGKTRGGYDGSFAADQYNTTWRTEDGRVVFRVGEAWNDPIRCFIETEEETVEVILEMSRLVSMIEIAYPEDVEKMAENEPFPGFAMWSWTEWDKTTLVVTVKETIYLEPGQELVFHRVEPDT